MADETFESIDAIEKHFGKLRKAASDDEEKVRSIALEEREAKADFREQSAIRRELAAVRKSALEGIPEDFQEFVTGATPEEIDASAKKVKERIEKLTAGNAQQGAERLYGTPIGPGGGSPPPPRTTADEQWIADFQQRFSDPGGSVNMAEINQYVGKLGGAHLLHELARTSSSFQRAGITPELVAQHESGQLQQTRPSRTGVTQAPRG